MSRTNRGFELKNVAAASAAKGRNSIQFNGREEKSKLSKIEFLKEKIKEEHVVL